jgi:hypothetical protein
MNNLTTIEWPFAAAVGSSCSPQVVDAQKKLEKTKKKQVISNFLRGRGTVVFKKKEGAPLRLCPFTLLLLF